MFGIIFPAKCFDWGGCAVVLPPRKEMSLFAVVEDGCDVDADYGFEEGGVWREKI